MNEPQNLPSFSEIVDHPLYRSIDLSSRSPEERAEYIDSIKNPLDAFEAYCVYCKASSIFRVRRNGGSYLAGAVAGPGRFAPHIIFTPCWCAKDPDHDMYFLFLVDGDTLTKIGQHPSLGELGRSQADRYRSVLPDEKVREFKRAINLASSDVGIAAYVYLRRIFEYLLEEAHLRAKEEGPNWDENVYVKSRVDERIELLRVYLPDFLVDHRVMYGILSKGLHELSEQECLIHFDVLRGGIELILDEKLEERRRRQKIGVIGKAIQQIHQAFKSKDADS